MVTSNKERQRVNKLRASRKNAKAKAKAKLAKNQPVVDPEPTQTQAESVNHLLPAGVRKDDQVLIGNLDLPTRAIAVLEYANLRTKGDVRAHISENGTTQDLQGIGPSWADKIEEAVR